MRINGKRVWGALVFVGVFACLTSRAESNSPESLLKGNYLYTRRPFGSNFHSNEVLDERKSILKEVQRILFEREGHSEEISPEDRPKDLPPELYYRKKVGLWGSIKLEDTVYFKNGKDSNYKEYTIFASSDKMTPKDFKIQFHAKLKKDESIKNAPYKVSIYNAEYEPAGLLPMRILNSQGEMIYTNSKHDPVSLEKFQLDTVREKNLIPVEGFFNERAYAPPPAKDKKIHVEFDEDLILKTAPVALGEAGIWAASNRIGKLNTGKLRVLRRLGKVFLVAEQGGHIINAYEVINEGGKPKYSELSLDLFGKVEDLAAKGYKEIKSLSLFESQATGVLKDETSVKTELERDLLPHRNEKLEDKPSSHGDSTEKKRPVDKDLLKKLNGNP